MVGVRSRRSKGESIFGDGIVMVEVVVMLGRRCVCGLGEYAVELLALHVGTRDRQMR